jgi:Forkhead domain
MGPEPTEDEYDDLPFKLPPGPYSHTKPDLPYAAIIGQAILASPEHRLTLQEIYDYITIVYPHFKRDEQTWMNSIRHVLSTTIVFRKVQRDRAAGRTLWAIFDQDLDCFAGGGFRKEFCADMQELREKARQSRKRSAEDTPTRKPRKKRLKTDASQEQVPPAMHPQMGIPMSTLPAMAYPGPPMFPGPRPGTHHQPYYTPYVMPHPHAIPAGVIFPVLPPGSVYNPVNTEPTPPAPEISRPSTTSSFVSRVKMEPEESPSPSLPPTSCSSVSLPELTPNNSSSSPTGELDDQCAVPQVAESSSRESASVSPQFDISAFLVVPEDAPLDALAPGVTLLNSSAAAAISGAKSKSKSKSKKGKEKVAEKEPTTQVSNLDFE